MNLNSFFFFFNDTATTEIYTLSLHDALPICHVQVHVQRHHADQHQQHQRLRSEEHTSELQSPCNLVCRLLLEKKKKKTHTHTLSPDVRIHRVWAILSQHTPTSRFNVRPTQWF